MILDTINLQHHDGLFSRHISNFVFRFSISTKYDLKPKKIKKSNIFISCSSFNMTKIYLQKKADKKHRYDFHFSHIQFNLKRMQSIYIKCHLMLIYQLVDPPRLEFEHASVPLSTLNFSSKFRDNWSRFWGLHEWEYMVHKDQKALMFPLCLPHINLPYMKWWTEDYRC